MRNLLLQFSAVLVAIQGSLSTDGKQGVVALEVEPGSEYTEPFGKRIETSLNYRGQKRVRIGKTTYICKLNIKYNLSPPKCARSFAKCKPIPKKPIGIKVNTNDAILRFSVDKNKVSGCTVEPTSVTTTPTDTIKELKEKFTELEASFEKLKADMQSKCDADTCSNIQTTTSKVETCLGDVSSKECPLSPNGKIGLAAALDEKCDKSTCDPPRSVLWMGSGPWTTLTIPDFSPASPNCTIPDADFHKEPGQVWGQVYYGQKINGVMYICGEDKCQSYKSQNKGWETELDMKLTRSRAGSTLIPGPNPKWIVHGGDGHGGQDPTQDVWTPETRKWEVDPEYRSPLPVYGHCIVALEGKILQIGGVNDGAGHYQKRVFLGEDEVASMKNLVWVAGGGGWFSEAGLVEVYNHTADTWTDGPALPLEKHDNYPKLLEIQGSLYYIGGHDAGKIFKLENNAWIEVASVDGTEVSIPKSTILVAAVLEVEC